MFGNKNKPDNIPVGELVSAEQKTLRIYTIPGDFYGGKNPAIYTEKKVSALPKSKEILPIDTEEENISPPISKKKYWIMGGGLFVLITVGVTAYYLYDAGIIGSTPEESPSITEPVVEPTVEPQPEPEPEPEPVVEPDPNPEPIIPTTTVQIEFPPINSEDTDDLDEDGLTDEEELVFGTDPGMWDTDGDSYYDGQEVANLYNPRGFAPVRIIDATQGIVRNYINPVHGYQLYYPTAWTIAAVDSDADEVLISNISGDYIAIYTRTLQAGERFQDWLIREAGGQRITDISSFENRFDMQGFRRSDRLVAYFGDGETIYTLVYYSGGTGSIAYREVMNVVSQSFRTASYIPPVVVAPPTSTSTVDTSTSSTSIIQ